MNREILFRGKSTIDGNWVYGCPNYAEQENKYYIGVMELMSPVIPETVGQFIPLQNGLKTFEGDKVKIHYFYEALGEGLGVYEAEKEIEGYLELREFGPWLECDNEDDSSYLLWIPLHEESIIVTGNIHDNQ